MDSLRAMAVVAVLLQHWFGDRVPIGTWGVALFFVISGYLISRSLFSLRDADLAFGAAALHFFARRTARLFPAYYLTLVVGALLFEAMRPDWFWYAAYLSNHLLDYRQMFVPLTPAWSLAIEEQFYLVWFLVVMLVAPRTVWLLVLLMLAIAPVARYLTLAQGNHFGIYLLWANCDALAAGVLLCLLERRGVGRKLLSARAAVFILLASISSALLADKWHALWGPFGAVVPSAIVLASVYLVAATRTGLTGLAGRILEWPALVYLGKISYGVYLYHMLTPEIARLVFSGLPGLWRFAERGSAVGFASHLVLTIVIASVSFRVFEMPLRRFTGKRFAPTTPQPAM